MSPNLAASVRARLLNLAKKSGRGYNALQLLYFQERFLARLARSPYRKQLVLKGGLFLYGRYGEAARPTQDIDLHGQTLQNEVADVLEAMRAIAAVDLAEDGVRFNLATLTAAPIQVEADYPGVRVRLEGILGKAREVLWLDVSFGNVITPAPSELDFPTLLAVDSPRLLASSLETVLAEKLQAAAALGISNSRAKDFYDLFQAGREGGFNATDQCSH
jgi:predicted nucleotidyltransferase component of viral defense system